MSLLIQGPKQPGNDIDVYLAPLLEGLVTLWNEGVQVWDAYKRENFTLCAMLFCTINDFSALGNLSGFSTKGAKACPHCLDGTESVWLNNSRKTVYIRHRRLPRAGKSLMVQNNMAHKEKFSRLYASHTCTPSFHSVTRSSSNSASYTSISFTGCFGPWISSDIKI